MRNLLSSVLALTIAASCGLPDDSKPETDESDSREQAATGGIAEGSAEAVAVLKIANTANEAELTGKAQLPAATANGMVGYRRGDDLAFGTADDERFDTLAELDAVPFVGPAEFRKLVDYAKSIGLLSQGATLTFSSKPAKAIRDNQTTSDTISVPSAGPSGSIKVSVDIKHTYIGDLVIRLSHGGVTAVLQQNKGGSADDLVATFTSTAFSALDRQGSWVLEVSDVATRDEGQLVGWSLELSAPAPTPPPAGPTPEQCLTDWRALNGACPAPTITRSYVGNGCVGTTGWFVEGTNFQLEQHNAQIADYGPQSFGANGNQKHWNIITPTKLCVTVYAGYKSTWVGATVYVKNPDGKVSNSVVVTDAL